MGSEGAQKPSEVLPTHLCKAESSIHPRSPLKSLCF